MKKGRRFFIVGEWQAPANGRIRCEYSVPIPWLRNSPEIGTASACRNM